MERVGPYEIQSEIARGGMGVVFRARAPGGDEVALKLMLAAHSARADQLKRFEREGQALLRLDHPHVVRVRDVGRHERGPYLVMDLVEGESLAERLERAGPFTPGQAATVAAHLARALAHAHEHGLLHRDVKPDNVIWTPERRALLTDFGLAKDLDPEVSRLSRTGQFLGTPGFWSPEQARGEVSELTPAIDVYGLGATLYAMLTGAPPIEAGDMIENLVATAERVPDPPSALRPEVDARLDALVLRCLAKAPGERYPSAAALGDALDLYLTGGAEPTPTGRRWVLPLVALVAIGLALGAALWVPGVLAERRKAEARRLVDVALTARIEGRSDAAHAAFARALELDPDCEEALVHRAHTYRVAGDLKRALADLDRLIELDPGSLRDVQHRAHLREDAGDIEGALADWTRTLSLGGQGHMAHNRRGKLYELQGDRATAIKEYTTALAFEPRAVDSLMLRGKALADLGQTDEAIDDFTAAIAISPSYHPALYRRGRLLQERGDLEGALEDFSRAAARSPRAELLFRRGWVLLELGRLDPALGCFEEALDKSPRHVGALSGRANVCRLQGRWAEAVAAYRAALEALPAGDASEGILRDGLAKAEKGLAESGR